MGKRLLSTVWSCIVMILTIAGIGGLAFNMFRDGGWSSTIVGTVFDAEMRSPLIVTPVILFTIWIAWLALTGRLGMGKGNPLGNLIVYALAIAGAYFLSEWYLA